MTPPAAAAAPRTRSRAQPRRTPPRRVSGPVRGRAAARPAPPRLAVRLGGAVHGIAEHRLLERVIRGRAWIAIVGIGLIGIVFMQVSMLRMNAGIGRAVERSSLLERQNSAMRASISELSSGDRVAAEAAKLGYVLPPGGSVRFLDASSADAARAASSIRPPGEMLPLIGAETTEDPAAATLPETGMTADPALAAAPADPGAATTTTTTESTPPPAETADPATPTTTTPAATAEPASPTTASAGTTAPSTASTGATAPSTATTAAATGAAVAPEG